MERGVTPPTEALPPGPFGTNSFSVLPKVQIPFITSADAPPRAVEIERL
jgi:hypothetical protein